MKALIPEKKISVLAARLWFANFCRIHGSTRITPAMALSVTDHIWTIGELIEAALKCEAPEPVNPVPLPPQGRMVGPFRVIDGGLS